MSGRLTVWYGELTTPRRLRTRGALFVGWGLLWLVLFLALPALVLIAVAFTQRGEYGQIEWTFTAANFRKVLGIGLLGYSANNLLILGRSLLVAGVTTTACVLLAYPLAFFLANKPPRTRYLWLALVIVPFCTNVVVRTHGWVLLLSQHAPPSQAAAALGLLAPGDGLYPGVLAVYLGMISVFLPFAVLPLYTNVEKLDWSLLEAARDLYASRWGVFRHAILPQTLPGLTVAVVLTFVPAMGTFVVPAILSNGTYMLVGDLIQQQFKESRDYPYGAALSLVMMGLTLLGLWLIWTRRKGAGLA